MLPLGKSLSFILKEAELSVSLNVPPRAASKIYSYTFQLAHHHLQLTPVKVTVAFALPAGITTSPDDKIRCKISISSRS